MASYYCFELLLYFAKIIFVIVLQCVTMWYNVTMTTDKKSKVSLHMLCVVDVVDVIEHKHVCATARVKVWSSLQDIYAITVTVTGNWKVVTDNWKEEITLTVTVTLTEKY